MLLSTQVNLELLVRGGDNHISNIVPACGRCNRAKGVLTDDEYFKLLADTFAYGGGGTSVDGAGEPSRPFPGPVSLNGEVVRLPSRGTRTRAVSGKFRRSKGPRMAS